MSLYFGLILKAASPVLLVVFARNDARTRTMLAARFNSRLRFLITWFAGFELELVKLIHFLAEPLYGFLSRHNCMSRQRHPSSTTHHPSSTIDPPSPINYPPKTAMLHHTIAPPNYSNISHMSAILRVRVRPSNAPSAGMQKSPLPRASVG